MQRLYRDSLKNLHTRLHFQTTTTVLLVRIPVPEQTPPLSSWPGTRSWKAQLRQWDRLKTGSIGTIDIPMFSWMTNHLRMISNSSFNFLFIICLLFYLTILLDSRVSILSAATMEFGLVPPEHWHQPDWIDEEKATASRNQMMADNIIYGGSVSYRNMCRYNSGVRCDNSRARSIDCNIYFDSSSSNIL